MHQQPAGVEHQSLPFWLEAESGDPDEILPSLPALLAALLTMIALFLFVVG